MNSIVGVKFKKNEKVYKFLSNGLDLYKGDYVIVDTINGNEYAEVIKVNSIVINDISNMKYVIRKATLEDTKHHEGNIIMSKKAFKICKEKIEKYCLDMRLISADYTFDNSKLIFKFVSTERVDFRELVKELAYIFKTRIELKQLGDRDKAKIVGALASCGQECCCSRFKNDFSPISISMAKNQNFALNSLKVSGMCGKLKCCLKYENDTYTELKKEMPKRKGTIILNGEKKEILEVDIFKKKVKIKEVIDGEIYKGVWVDYPQKCCKKKEVDQSAY